MKKIILSVAVLFCTFAVFAQNAGTWECDGGISYSFYDRAMTRNSEITDSSEGSSQNNIILPTFSIRGGYVLPDGHWGFYMNVFMAHAWNKLTGGPDVLRERETVWHLMPEARVYYSNKSRLKMYASAGIGLRLRHFSETLGSSDTIHDAGVGFCWQVSPFSISIGEKFNVSFDFGAGTAWSGIKLNAGYRF